MGKDIFDIKNNIPKPKGLVAGETTYFTVPVEHLNYGKSPMFNLIIKCDGKEIINKRCESISSRKTENITVSATIDEPGEHKIYYRVEVNGKGESWETRYYSWESGASLPDVDFTKENMEKRGNDSSRYSQRIYDDQNILGQVDDDGDKDWYIISFNKSGKANFWVKPLHEDLDVDIYVYDKDDLDNYVKRSIELDGKEDLVSIDVKANRDYYIRIKHAGNIPSGSNGDKYWLRCKSHSSFNPNERSIAFRGNSNTNKSSRKGEIPIIIVDHITGGTFKSADNWFRSSGNKVSSAHFIVDRDGSIYQYVDMKDKAWANGNTDGFSAITSKVCNSKPNINPNNFSVSIEHVGTDGSLTSNQFEASVWLHKYIQNYVKKNYNHTISLDRDHVIGHYEIAPRSKPYCPGPKFPWNELMNALK